MSVWIPAIFLRLPRHVEAVLNQITGHLMATESPTAADCLLVVDVVRAQCAKSNRPLSQQDYHHFPAATPANLGQSSLLRYCFYAIAIVKLQVYPKEGIVL
jgi:hypothetical protein